MCSITDHVAEGILKYSLIPYAISNDIEIKELIQNLYDYYNSNHIKSGSQNNILTIKKGRPKGSKNKEKEKNTNDEPNEKRKRGRPKGSTKKKAVAYEANND